MFYERNPKHSYVGLLQYSAIRLIFKQVTACKVGWLNHNVNHISVFNIVNIAFALNLTIWLPLLQSNIMLLQFSGAGIVCKTSKPACTAQPKRPSNKERSGCHVNISWGTSICHVRHAAPPRHCPCRRGALSVAALLPAGHAACPRGSRVRAIGRSPDQGAICCPR